MPIFSSEEWQRVERLWDELVDAEAETRAERLAELAIEDPDLAERLGRMLRASLDVGGPLDRPVWEVAPDLLSEPSAADRKNPGKADLLEAEAMVGPYRIVREIGRGGMGSVYLAVRADDQYRKEVAIKLVSADRDNQRLIRRFLRERQILATLEHPHIARLLDGGVTEQGVPYLVMEYVTGRRLDRYCDDERLTVAERLRLFEDVCRAVHYAHTKLVVHRDLKPGNVMVTDDRSVKLLDFGIAKLLDPEPDSSGDTMTRAGGRVLTPEYASPEHLRGDPVGTASDVYSLGVFDVRIARWPTSVRGPRFPARPRARRVLGHPTAAQSGGGGGSRSGPGCEESRYHSPQAETEPRRRPGQHRAFGAPQGARAPLLVRSLVGR